ncbi:MAG: hypothetical protein FVQ80_16205 [Planctomycetes bacterium]|nr:hypothetical protein [Planctomycetota bacterium]
MTVKDLALELWPIAAVLITFGLAWRSNRKSDNTANKLDTIDKSLNKRIDFFERLIHRIMDESSKLTDDSIKSSTDVRQFLFEIIKTNAKKDQVPETGDTEKAFGSAASSIANLIPRIIDIEYIRSVIPGEQFDVDGKK